MYSGRGCLSCRPTGEFRVTQAAFFPFFDKFSHLTGLKGYNISGGNAGKFDQNGKHR